jgi:chemotaxis protein methyltransferase CheR
MKNRSVPEQLFSKPFLFIKKIPGVSALVKTNVWQMIRFKITLLVSRRQNCHFTSLLRLPTQYEALAGPVLDFLVKNGTKKTLKITVLGCSNGAEVYSIASVLRNQYPDLLFDINAYDIDQQSIDKARSARYTQQEVYNTEYLTDDFVHTTFNQGNDFYEIKNDLRKSVHFDVADALSPELKERLGTSDIIYAQHFLIHLETHKAIQAFNNICKLLNPIAVLFIAGMELDMLVQMTRKNNLMPMEYKIEEIYKEMGIYGKGWPYTYCGCEPFMTVRTDWQRRYATIFFRT